MKLGRHSKYPYQTKRICEWCKKEETVLIINHDQTRAYHFCSDLCKHEQRSAACRENRWKRSTTPHKYDRSAPRAARPRQPKKKKVVPVDNVRAARDAEYIRQLRLMRGLPEVRA